MESRRASGMSEASQADGQQRSCTSRPLGCCACARGSQERQDAKGPPLMPCTNTMSSRGDPAG